MLFFLVQYKSIRDLICITSMQRNTLNKLLPNLWLNSTITPIYNPLNRNMSQTFDWHQQTNTKLSILENLSRVMRTFTAHDPHLLQCHMEMVLYKMLNYYYFFNIMDNFDEMDIKTYVIDIWWTVVAKLYQTIKNYNVCLGNIYNLSTSPSTSLKNIIWKYLE